MDCIKASNSKAIWPIQANSLLLTNCETSRAYEFLSFYVGSSSQRERLLFVNANPPSAQLVLACRSMSNQKGLLRLVAVMDFPEKFESIATDNAPGREGRKSSRGLPAGFQPEASIDLRREMPTQCSWHRNLSAIWQRFLELNEFHTQFSEETQSKNHRRLHPKWATS